MTPAGLEAKLLNSSLDSNFFQQPKLRCDFTYLSFNLQNVCHAIMMPIRIKNLCHRGSRASRVCPGSIFLGGSILSWIELAQAHKALRCVVLRRILILTRRRCSGSVYIKRDKIRKGWMWKQDIQ